MRLTEKAHLWVSKFIRKGDVCVDLTAGNGWDTLFLSNAVGVSGSVFAFDLQASSIANTQRLLYQQGRFRNYELVKDCHSRFPLHLPERHNQKVSVFMINTGYLPGSDKQVITRPASTCKALEKALEWLKEDGGILSILAYQGHAGGEEETKAIEGWIRDRGVRAVAHLGNESERSPVLYGVEKVKMDL